MKHIKKRNRNKAENHNPKATEAKSHRCQKPLRNDTIRNPKARSQRIYKPEKRSDKPENGETTEAKSHRNQKQVTMLKGIP